MEVLCSAGCFSQCGVLKWCVLWRTKSMLQRLKERFVRLMHFVCVFLKFSSKVSLEQGKLIAQSCGAMFQETSARSGDGELSQRCFVFFLFDQEKK